MVWEGKGREARGARRMISQSVLREGDVGDSVRGQVGGESSRPVAKLP